ncbi:MAG: hypothetical protein NC217_07320 [Muribaculaceae bacterium]|nr:hypothetical protein [Muribaculaceae bacterium]
MEIYTIDYNNVATALTHLRTGGKHFIIAADVPCPKGALKIGSNSILDFRGGSLTTSTKTTISLNSCQILAGAYPIFNGDFIVTEIANAEVRAEWFKSDNDTSDDIYINRAINAANGCPVLLEARKYILKNSIQFKKNTSRQTLICPGEFVIDNEDINVPAICVNTQTVTLIINKISGNESTAYHGVGIRFIVYNEHSNIQINTMRKLHIGICVYPDTLERDENGDITDEILNKNNKLVPYGGLQYCRINFGVIDAEYCFYIDIYSYAKPVYHDKSENKPVDTVPTDKTERDKLSLEITNWFTECQIVGTLMRGKYGIYTVDKTKILKNFPTAEIDKINSVMNGLLFKNISFEDITELPIRLREVIRSGFLNLQMFNNLPGHNATESDDFAPWVDLDNISDIRMSFDSYVMPTHFKTGSNCRNSFVYGAIMDKPGTYVSHFDVLGIDTLVIGYDSKDNPISGTQMFVTNSIVPFNIVKNIKIDKNDNTTTRLSLRDLLPDLNEGFEDNDTGRINLPVLPSTLNIDIAQNKTLVIDITGLDKFPPCLYNVYVKMSDAAKVQFLSRDYLAIINGIYNPEGYPSGSSLYTFLSGGYYQLQWQKNFILEIKKTSN